MSSYSLHKTLIPAHPGKAGPVNAVLFFDDGTRLATGGDDQVLRIWDVQSGDCRQELRDPHWGQITCLSMMQNSSVQTLELFIGTGRGVVSICAWNRRNHQFTRQAGRPTTVFKLDDPVEAQAVDPIRFKYAVASHQGQIKLYLVKDRTSLIPLWTYELDSNVPRSVLFLGDNNEQLTVHNLKPGPILHLDPITGAPAPQSHQLLGGVGSVAMSPDRRMKAIHNITSDQFDLYGPGSSTPTGLRVSSSSGKIKGAAFGEGGKTLVCGGDDGFIHIFDVLEGVERETFTLSSDCSTVFAVTTCTTKEYHLIASGGSELPAAIYIWGKPTDYKKAIDQTDAMERAAAATLVLKKATEKAEAAQAVKSAREAKAARETQVAELARHVKFNEIELAIGVLIVACVIVWRAGAYLAGSNVAEVV